MSVNKLRLQTLVGLMEEVIDEKGSGELTVIFNEGGIQLARLSRRII